MGLTSLQVCMDSSDWFHQGSVIHNNEDHVGQSGIGSSSPSSEIHDIMLTCPRPPNTNTNMNIKERRLRPPHDGGLRCPRCDSGHTKFCYYNNYSLSQPRYFCKTCRRYWTRGGSLRNIPVGGACRKTKKPSNSSNPKKPEFAETKYNVDNDDNHVKPIDFMTMSMGQPARMINTDYGHFSDLGASPLFGAVMMMDHFNNNNMNNCSSNVVPYEEHGDDQNVVALMDVKPKLLSLQWHDHDQDQDQDQDRQYLGSWSGGMINGYGGSSATNALI